MGPGAVLRLLNFRHYGADGRSWVEYRANGDGRAAREDKEVFVVLLLGVEPLVAPVTTAPFPVDDALRDFGYLIGLDLAAGGAGGAGDADGLAAFAGEAVIRFLRLDAAARDEALALARKRAGAVVDHFRPGEAAAVMDALGAVWKALETYVAAVAAPGRGADEEESEPQARKGTPPGRGGLRARRKDLTHE